MEGGELFQRIHECPDGDGAGAFNERGIFSIVLVFQFVSIFCLNSRSCSNNVQHLFGC